MKKIRLLTVDDDKFIRDLVIKTLRAQYTSFDITEADNGRKAQAALQKHSFDLVLCDWEMPEITGMELLHWVRANEKLKDQPFILITSLDKKENVQQALRAGVSDYIAKPFTPDQLYKKVMKQLIKSECLTAEEAAQLTRKDRIGAAGGAELLAAGVGARPAAPRKMPLPKALLIQGERRATATLRDLNPREALLLVKRADFDPELGSPLHLGLVGGADEQPVKVSLRAYVSSLQLAERNPKTENAFIRLQLLKQDAETSALFERLLKG